jgi:4-hydroxy-tetrahydrodipicolinate synthase
MLGGSGGVCGGANLFPRLYVAIYEAALCHDAARVAELHAKVIHISATLYRVGNHGSAVIKGLKCALHLAGICHDYMAEPFHSFREPERKRVLALVEELRADLGELA